MTRKEKTLTELLDKTYLSIDPIHQEQLRQTQELQAIFARAIKAATKAKEIPDNATMVNWAKLGKAVVDLVKEGRALEKARAVSEKLDDAELVADLEPLLIKLGWMPPQEQS